MKKPLSILLAVVLMFAMAIPVLAEDVSSDDVSGETSKVVTAARVEGENVSGGTVYYVTVAWNVNSSLTYTDGNTTYNWNAESTEYVKSDKAAGTWSGTATVTVTVTNKSNDKVVATPSWQAENGITTTCSLGDAVTVESAAKDTKLNGPDQVLKGAEQIGTIVSTVNTPTAGSIDSNDAPVGTITVKIEKVA